MQRKEKKQREDGGKHFCNGRPALLAAILHSNQNSLTWNNSNQDQHPCNGLKTMLLTSIQISLFTPNIKQGNGYEISNKRWTWNIEGFSHCHQHLLKCNCLSPANPWSKWIWIMQQWYKESNSNILNQKPNSKSVSCRKIKNNQSWKLFIDLLSAKTQPHRSWLFTPNKCHQTQAKAINQRWSKTEPENSNEMQVITKGNSF